MGLESIGSAKWGPSVFPKQQIHGVGPDPLLQIQLYFGQVAGEHYKGPESVVAFVNSKRLEGGNKRDLEDILSSEDSEPVFITWILNHYSGFCYN